MGLFEKTKHIIPKSFDSRASAYMYMLNYQLTEKCADPMIAAEQADKFANIFSKNMGLPDLVKPPETGLKKYMGWAKEVAQFAQENPKVIEIGTALITFGAGLFAGKNIEQDEESNKVDKIDFSNITNDFSQTTDKYETTEVEENCDNG